MLKRKLMGLGLCVYMVATTCVGVLAVTNFTGSSNCYNKSYTYTMTGDYDDTMIATSGGSTSYTVMKNTGSVKRYMYAHVYEYNLYTSTTVESATASGAVSGGSTLQTAEISRTKTNTRYKYIHSGTVYGGATTSTSELDYFKYSIFQTK